MALDEEQIFRTLLDAQRAVNADTREDSVRAAMASAVHQILRAGEFPVELYTPPSITTVSGTPAYSLHADVAVVKSVRITDSSGTAMLPFRSLDLVDEDRYDGGTQTNSEPVCWTIDDGKLAFFPTPDAAYTITYRAERRGGDVARIPEEFLDVVLFGARSVFDPQFLGVFNRGLRDVMLYYKQQRQEQKVFRKDEAVEAHEAWQWSNNVH